MVDNPDDKKGYVVFKDAESWWFFKPFLRRGFSHCFYFKPVGAGFFWLIVDGTSSHTELMCIPQAVVSFEDLTKDGVYVEVEPEIDINKVCYTLSLNNCVDVVKRILGIRATFCLTPYQLYERLK